MRRPAIGWSSLLLVGAGVPLVLLEIYPHWPISPTGWLVVVLAGPPMLLALELCGEMIFSDSTSRRISDKTFSAVRIAFGLIIFLVYLGALYVGWTLFGDFL